MDREQFKRNLRKVEKISALSDKLSNLGIETLQCRELFYASEIFFDWVKSEFGEEGEDIVAWWMYEDVDKILYVEDGTEIDLEDINDLYNYLEAIKTQS